MSESGELSMAEKLKRKDIAEQGQEDSVELILQEIVLKSRAEKAKAILLTVIHSPELSA